MSALPAARRQRSNRLRFLAAVFPALLLVGTTVSPAQAVQPKIASNSGGAHVRACPSTSCSSYGYYANGNNADMICYRDAATATTGNYSSRRWFYVAVSSSSGTYLTEGWMHSSLVSPQTSTPAC